MSAYMCGVEHWSVLAERISRYDQRTAAQLFDLLTNENKTSIDYRYAEGLKGDPDYMYDHTDPFEGGYRVPADLLWSDDEYVIMAQGYDYQSCEHPDYRNSEAYALIMDLLERLTGTPQGPGFDVAVVAATDRAKKAREYMTGGSLWNVSERDVSLATFEDAKAAMREYVAKCAEEAGVKL